MGPTLTNNILVIYGHGGILDDTFNFQRASGQQLNLYSWTRESIPVWDTQIELAANDALTNGKIRDSYATVNSSRVGGTLLTDYVLQEPAGLRMPTIPAHNTPVPGLGGIIHHNNTTVATSNRLLFTMNTPAPFTIRLSDILMNSNFAGRAIDVLWCACKS